MSRVAAVFRREFNESVRTKMFAIGTIFGPVLIGALFLLPALLMRGGPAERSIVIADASGRGTGQQVEALLAPPADAPADNQRTIYRLQVVDVAGRQESEVRAELQPRVEAEELHGVLWIPADVYEGGQPRYEGKNATSFRQMGELRSAVQQAVQQQRLSELNVDPARLAQALQPVPFEARTPAGSGGESLFLLAYVMGYGIFLVVMLFGAAVMRGTLEEKRDKIVEVIVSSMRARDLLLGKVLGIGGAALLQVAVWVAFAAIVLAYGDEIAARMGVTLPELPRVPLSVGIVLLIFFAGGFFLYASLYAAIGAIATTDQEAQQLMFPVMLPLLVGYMMMFSISNDAEGTVAVAGSLIPFTSPLVMPMRMSMAEVPPLEVAASLLLLIGAGLAVIWLAAKIYRIGMLATGKRPTMRELGRWLRTA